MTATLKPKIKIYTKDNIHTLPQFEKISKEKQFELKVVASILPFRVNNYVTDNLVDWDNLESDPLCHLNFMQKDMLSESHFNSVAQLISTNQGNTPLFFQTVNRIRLELNPHPSGQLTSNVPNHDDEPVSGVQHKYRQTVLVFPKQGQTCHSYCTFCFRWAQFSDLDDLRFATDQHRGFLNYIKEHKELTDVLITGGDPMIMNARILKTYIEPLLGPEYSHIQTIRIGSKTLSYWPYRYISDRDTNEVLALFEKAVAANKTLAFMAHVNHHRELETDAARQAVKAIQGTGAIIRSQSPILKHINDAAAIWERNWNLQVRMGIIPYYMFVERDTGPQNYFAIPLIKALEVYRTALKNVSGLARTARGPSMSATPGKVNIEDVQVIRGQKVMVLKFLQGRDPEWVGKPFYAKFDPEAKWLTDLKPAFGEKQFFFERDIRVVNSAISNI
ncbi:MAG: lysine 2,3-aminomutase [Oligoflexales bacterium]|nr:lysine 2,3-aminomutase [Oligoflexales bacterium]